jgi:hypothetical protein
LTLSKEDFEYIINDRSKHISRDIEWREGRNSPAFEFRVDINTAEGYPIFLSGWYNPASEKLSYSIIHRRIGRIYGLDLGAEHRNPNGQFIGETHKNFWVEGYRDKWAYPPNDITEPFSNPVGVWRQFCGECNLHHMGHMKTPIEQGRLSL